MGKHEPTTQQQKINLLLELNQSGMSLQECAAELGVHPVTVSKWVREHDLKVIRHGRKKDSSKWVEHTCDQCGKNFSIQQSQKRRFCSRDCTNTWQRAQVKARVCDGCGEPLEIEDGATTMYTYRKYCSKACRMKYGAKRQKDETKWVTFNCQTCGEETTKRLSSGNQNKFCSNTCAMKHTKTVRHYVCRESDMVLDSTWEMLFAGICGFDRIHCERYDRARAVEWKPGQWYAPDFWLPKMSTAVEIKGLEDDEDPERWDLWRLTTQQRLLILDRDALDQLLIAGDRECWLKSTYLG